MSNKAHAPVEGKASDKLAPSLDNDDIIFRIVFGKWVKASIDNPDQHSFWPQLDTSFIRRIVLT